VALRMDDAGKRALSPLSEPPGYMDGSSVDPMRPKVFLHAHQDRWAVFDLTLRPNTRSHQGPNPKWSSTVWRYRSSSSSRALNFDVRDVNIGITCRSGYVPSSRDLRSSYVFGCAHEGLVLVTHAPILHTEDRTQVGQAALH
jgi:hypothetical protein